MTKKRGRKKIDIKDEDIKKAITGSCAILSVIAKRLNIDWNICKKLINKNKEIYQKYLEEQQVTIDLAENVILKAIIDNDVATAKWYLQLKAKDRGYAETINVNSSLDSETLKELEKFFNG